MKVLGVGLSRTGTTSLTKAFEILGYNTVHWDQAFVGILRKAATTGSIDLSRYDDIDGLTDVPACLFYDEFIARYPGLKLVLTVRDERAWVKSISIILRKHRVNLPRDYLGMEWYCRVLAYGSLVPDLYLMKRGYRQHNKRVIAEVDPSRLLVMDIASGDGWEKLCPFLGKEIPDEPFPWLNKTYPDTP